MPLSELGYEMGTLTDENWEGQAVWERTGRPPFYARIKENDVVNAIYPWLHLVLGLRDCSYAVLIADRKFNYEMNNWSHYGLLRAFGVFSMRSWTVSWKTLSRIVTSGSQRLTGCAGRRAGSQILWVPLILRQSKRTSMTATRWSSSRPEYSKIHQVR